MSFKINIIKDKLLSENWFVLRNYTYEITDRQGEVIRHKREVYDRGNGATILLYNREKNSVVLTRQFRIATYVNGNDSGMLIEACAGLLDDDTPEDCIRKEAIEETGYAVGEVEKLYSCYMSPGGVTELIHFFAAEYHDALRDNAGGGVDDESIDVLELRFPDALAMVADGRIRDGKTIMLLQHARIAGWLTP
ncbi:GDP-mannose pyrophosphatase NudK [Pantoea anthophila]|jgi:GDP-mannose pyrophosphatase NudK|uniref:GDP-mannose pyrophosphatase n=1 Tax=Pantoea anthophila TaxID=470931 RepID=A0ABY2ZD79_9GAMM|nr:MULTISPECIES: GDP-mannose pyrophosphatase NudK [Pantoea]KAF6661370.1 GDP-mannose pyrophosphatase NudK [Enterobacteriaceae bacterium EKM102V]KAF6663310.1 GDP-mannose pyrophosphatase NudK [Pantoea sp. EKM101V]KAF6665621.1 GDP-mannose pyrophosphatase NudK [Pantoea sp. EKM103V]KKB03813.1 GDP-mannose pyrophosphatase [Pantoea anthophila]MEB5707135.1 GDP-mannose pyrophosphatase NudK [Pantoea anthophila]